jgi:ATP-dependent Clp protease ATP-binding subunit ClpB
MADFFKQNTKVTVTKTTIDMKIFTDIDAGDYRLKTLRLPSAALDEQPDQSIRRLGSPIRFSVETLCAAIQKKCTFDTIKWYLQSYEDSYGFKETAAQDGWPALYYAVERNSPGLLSILLQNGINPHKWYKGFPLPVIAFAIVHGHHEAVDTTGVVRLLLAFGVDPKVIPMDIWQNFLQSPKATGLSVWKFLDIATQLVDTDISWCTPEVRPRLAASLHLSHRYLLHLAHKLKKPNTRTLQISKANKMTDLGKLPYFLIGQQPAANLVMSNVYSYIAIGESKPMVMAFAGPSGHGKTELARALGDLLSVQTTVVDCASVTTVWGLFGPTAGWIGYENGSQLNNFLADNDSQRSVVFLDEFDKTEQKIRDALLLMTEKGRSTTSIAWKKHKLTDDRRVH